MGSMGTSAARIDLDKFRLRRFVERLIDMGEMEVHDEPVPLTRLSEIIEGTRKLGRDRDGRYHLVAAPPGSTGIIGELYYDPNEGV